MSHFCLRSWARAVPRGVLAASALALSSASLLPAAAQAEPVSIKLTYKCNFPLMLPQPLELTVKSDIPKSVPAGTLGQKFQFEGSAEVSAEAAHGLRALEAVKIEGTARASATLAFPDGFKQAVSVPTTITPRDIPTTGGFTTQATGSTPALNFEDVGEHEIRVGNLLLTLMPRLSDGTPTGLDEFETECFQDAGQNDLLTTINVTGPGDSQAPTKPTGLNGSAAETSATLSWTASTDNVAVTGYEVLQDGVKVQTVTSTTASITGLTAGKTYGFTVRAVDAAGNASPVSDELKLTTTTTAPDSYAYATTGKITLKTLTTGTLPLTGAMNAKYAEGGAVTADLTLNNTNGRLITAGFLPITAKVAFVATAPTTGTLSGGVLTTKSMFRIKVPEVRLFGAIPLAGGNSCQTKTPTAINLKSAAGFTPATGGSLSGTFAISDLNGCGPLNGLVNPLTAGGGNTINLTLTPKTTPAAR